MSRGAGTRANSWTGLLWLMFSGMGRARAFCTSRLACLLILSKRGTNGLGINPADSALETAQK